MTTVKQHKRLSKWEKRKAGKRLKEKLARIKDGEPFFITEEPVNRRKVSISDVHVKQHQNLAVATYLAQLNGVLR